MTILSLSLFSFFFVGSDGVRWLRDVVGVDWARVSHFLASAVSSPTLFFFQILLVF